MQSNTSKTKKTRKPAETSAPMAPEQVAPATEEMTNSRKKSSALPSMASESTSPVKKHRRAAKSLILDAAVDAGTDAGSTVAAVSSEDSLQLTTPATAHTVTQEDIAKRAYLYWVERGYQHGDPVQDWVRAESELIGR